MKFQAISGNLTGKVAAILFTAVLFLTALGFSHEDEEAGEIPKTSDTSLVHSQSIDSVYNIINEKYQAVRHIFEYSCFDCHSTKTNYPWYYNIPGIKGMIDDDIEEGLEHFDLTEDFPFKSKHSQLYILKEIKEEIEEGAMPLKSYRLTHWGRMIEGARRDSVFAWIDAGIEMLKNDEKSND